MTTFREHLSDLRTRCPETPLAGPQAMSERIHYDQNKGGPFPVYGDREGKSLSVEDNLKVSELKYRRLFETAQDAILILDGDNGNITRCKYLYS